MQFEWSLVRSWLSASLIFCFFLCYYHGQLFYFKGNEKAQPMHHRGPLNLVLPKLLQMFNFFLFFFHTLLPSFFSPTPFHSTNFYLFLTLGTYFSGLVFSASPFQFHCNSIVCITCTRHSKAAFLETYESIILS